MKETQLCSSAEALMDLAHRMASSLRGGEVFALEGDLGLGKTTFVKGMARGLGIQEMVTSPTFNLVHRYTGGRLPLVHFDFYRLKNAAELESLDLETVLESEVIVAIEWPLLAKDLLPSHRTQWITLEEMEQDGRRVIIKA